MRCMSNTLHMNVSFTLIGLFFNRSPRTFVIMLIGPASEIFNALQCWRGVNSILLNSRCFFEKFSRSTLKSVSADWRRKNESKQNEDIFIKEKDKCISWTKRKENNFSHLLVQIMKVYLWTCIFNDRLFLNKFVWYTMWRDMELFFFYPEVLFYLFMYSL